VLLTGAARTPKLFVLSNDHAESAPSNRGAQMYWRGRVWSLLLAVAIAVPIGGVGATLTARAAGASVPLYTDAGLTTPGSIAAGPDGALWFLNSNANGIGRITTTGTFSYFADPGHTLGTGNITAGPDGAMWFTNLDASIGRIDTTTDVVTNYTDVAVSQAKGITTGPDGALWFTDVGNNSIGRIDPTSHVITEYTDPSISVPTSITTGPDGALWFTNHSTSTVQGVATIGRINPTTHAITKYSAAITGPSSITAGPDGALWFTSDTSRNPIGRMTTSGSVKSYVDPGSHVLGADSIARGPDGALWFVNRATFTIGRITTAGTITKLHDVSVSGVNAVAIAAGPDGGMWFTEALRFGSFQNAIGRTTGTAPSPVRNPGAVPSGPRGALVVWKAPLSNGGSPITGYTITPYNRTTQEPPQTFNSPATSHTVTGLKKYGVYHFKITANNAYGSSALSANSNTATVGTPRAPAKPTVTKVAPGSLKVGFKPPSNNGSPIKKYTATCTPSKSRGKGAKAVTRAKGPITVSGLTHGQAYTCNVRATNAPGTGQPSPPSKTIKA
jgi:virginiamycin B lyase